MTSLRPGFGGLLAVAVLPALAGITGPVYLDPDALAAWIQDRRVHLGRPVRGGRSARRSHDH